MNQLKLPPDIKQGADMAHKSDSGECQNDKLTLRQHKQMPKTNIGGNMDTNKQTSAKDQHGWKHGYKHTSRRIGVRKL